MTIVTQFVYEKMWRPTSERDALKIIEEEVGDADPKGILDYVKSAIKEGKTITVGECRFKSDMK